jgi:2-oxoisovalerate dehydrogenase E1 component
LFWARIGQRGGNFATTTGLFALHGTERLRDTPICERGFCWPRVGAAMSGTRPVVDFMFADFVLDAAGEIINQIAKIQYMSSGRLKMPVLLRGCIGIGHSAATHHSGNYYAMYAHFPACASWCRQRRVTRRVCSRLRSTATTLCSSSSIASCLP